jgi:hypothetical protein
MLIDMSMTTIKITTELRDRLARLASEDYGGATLAEALRRLLAEHEEREALAAYERLRADEDEWASYRNESRLTDNAAGDWTRQDPAA